jgi:hypothetical protein
MPWSLHFAACDTVEHSVVAVPLLLLILLLLLLLMLVLLSLQILFLMNW